jgi:hypothetical protein
MKELLRKYENEKMRLNVLGQQSIELGISLAKNEAVQAQSRKVDELVIRFYDHKRSERAQEN